VCFAFAEVKMDKQVKNLKYFFVFSMLALLLLSFFPVAVAEEDIEETDDMLAQETLAEASGMYHGTGAEVRLLQLEKAITRNIILGNKIIAYLQGNNTNTTDLEAIVTEFEALKLEVQDLDPSSENATEDFVNIKQESIELSKEFRDTLRALIGKDNGPLLEGEIQQVDWSEIEEYNAEIKSKIHEQNAQIVGKLFESLGIENDELLEKVRNGEATFAEVRDVVAAAVKDMTPEERKEAWTELKEDGVRKMIAVRAKIEKARLNINERKATRLEFLTEASGQIKDPAVKARVQAALEKRSGVVDARIEKLSGRLEKIQEARQDIKHGILDRRTARASGNVEGMRVGASGGYSK
jgi:hypothetical protein